mmetsp:Transcript_41743/g.116382  ORF Transcript_41743/g.116382 Transcript_41743/m.116382 type:complete len:232 (+) Transcript_41743:808-1503(+)
MTVSMQITCCEVRISELQRRSLLRDFQQLAGCLHRPVRGLPPERRDAGGQHVPQERPRHLLPGEPHEGRTDCVLDRPEDRKCRHGQDDRQEAVIQALKGRPSLDGFPWLRLQSRFDSVQRVEQHGKEGFDKGTRCQASNDDFAERCVLPPDLGDARAGCLPPHPEFVLGVLINADVCIAVKHLGDLHRHRLLRMLCRRRLSKNHQQNSSAAAVHVIFASERHTSMAIPTAI